jgi:hypothetical protein
VNDFGASGKVALKIAALKRYFWYALIAKFLKKVNDLLN